MANEDHLRILRNGADEWDKCRKPKTMKNVTRKEQSFRQLALG